MKASINEPHLVVWQNKHNFNALSINELRLLSGIAWNRHTETIEMRFSLVLIWAVSR